LTASSLTLPTLHRVREAERLLRPAPSAGRRAATQEPPARGGETLEVDPAKPVAVTLEPRRDLRIAYEDEHLRS